MLMAGMGNGVKISPRKPETARAMRVRWKPLLVLAAICLSPAALLLGYMRWKRPPLMPPTEIYRGVYMEVRRLPHQYDGSGRVMIIEAHLDVPGVQLQIRPLTPEAVAQGKHYELSMADVQVRRYDTSVLMNGVLYADGDMWRSLPGMYKRDVGTLVIDGVTTHIFRHSYLLWWDKDNNATLETHKPPPADALAKARWAVSVQGIGVGNGVAAGYLDPGGYRMERSFIGIDPDRKIVWFVAFDSVSEWGMAHFCADLGIPWGGALDGGDARNLIIGRDANGVPDYTGMRGLRPLASWIGIHADPIVK